MARVLNNMVRVLGS